MMISNLIISHHFPWFDAMPLVVSILFSECFFFQFSFISSIFFYFCPALTPLASIVSVFAHYRGKRIIFDHFHEWWLFDWFHFRCLFSVWMHHQYSEGAKYSKSICKLTLIYNYCWFSMRNASNCKICCGFSMKIRCQHGMHTKHTAAILPPTIGF